MHVRVDEAGHDEPAPGVDKLGVRIFGAQSLSFAKFSYLLASDGNTALVGVVVVRIARDQSSVSNKQHLQYLLSS